MINLNIGSEYELKKVCKQTEEIYPSNVNTVNTVRKPFSKI